MENILYLVIPCYNEEEVLPETAARIKKKISDLIGRDKVDQKSRVIFVNDGSKDNTWNIITNLHKRD